MSIHRAFLIVLLASVGLVLGGCMTVKDRQLIESQSYSVSMDYDESVEDLVRSGNYSRVNSEINSPNFPSSETGSAELAMTLVRLGPGTSPSRLTAQEEKQGLRAATIRELLAFGKSYPELQKEISIVGLGSYRNYLTITHERFGMGPNDVQEVRELRRHYPALISDFFGRAAVLINEDLVPTYNPGGLYACFVQEAPHPES
jgi:hypothetical protein